jgi:hypothetical protein
VAGEEVVFLMSAGMLTRRPSGPMLAETTKFPDGSFVMTIRAVSWQEALLGHGYAQ